MAGFMGLTCCQPILVVYRQSHTQKCVHTEVPSHILYVLRDLQKIFTVLLSFKVLTLYDLKLDIRKYCSEVYLSGLGSGFLIIFSIVYHSINARLNP